MTISIFESARHRALVGLLLAASLVPIWAVDYFPSQNGPWHLLVAKMLRDYHNPAFNYAEFYMPSWHAIPHLAHTLLVSALSLMFPILVANKLAISLYVVLLPLSVFTLLSAIDRRRTVVGYASFLLVYNMPLLRGYHDYSLGVPVTMLTFAYWWRNRDQLTFRKRLVFVALSVLVYFSHLFNFFLLGAAVVLTPALERKSVREVAASMALLLPGAALLTEFAWFSATETTWLVRSEHVFLAPPAAVEAFFNHYFLTVSHTAYLVAVASLLVWVHVMCRGLSATWRGWRAGRSLAAHERVLPILLLALTLGYMVAPYKLLGWHYVNARFVPYVVVLGLACSTRMGRQRARVFTVHMTAAALVVFGLVTHQFARADRDIKEYVSGMPAVEMNSTLLPVSFQDSEIGEVSHVAHAYDYYQVFRGGANGQGIGRYNTVTPLVYRTYPISERFPLWRGRLSLREISAMYDYVLLWKAPAEIVSGFERTGFDLVYGEGRLRLMRNGHRPPAARAGG